MARVKFRVGRSYWMRSSVDDNSIFAVEIISRTEMTAVVKIFGLPKASHTINVIKGVETMTPLGEYPIVLSALRMIKMSERSNYGF